MALSLPALDTIADILARSNVRFDTPIDKYAEIQIFGDVNAAHLTIVIPEGDDEDTEITRSDIVRIEQLADKIPTYVALRDKLTGVPGLDVKLAVSTMDTRDGEGTEEAIELTVRFRKGARAGRLYSGDVFRVYVPIEMSFDQLSEDISEHKHASLRAGIQPQNEAKNP